MTQKQSHQTIRCPHCNGTMAATQTERGAYFVCGECKAEIQVNDRGTVEK